MLNRTFALLLLSCALPVGAQFRPAGPLVLPRGSHSATLLENGSVLLIGGASYDDKTAEIYDPKIGVSRLVASTMTRDHYGHAATRLRDGRVLISGGGYLGDGRGFPFGQTGTPFCEIFDPRTETFRATASMQAYRYLHTATLLPDGRVLVIGGNSLNVGGFHVYESYTNDCALFDPATETWSPAPKLVTPRAGHTTVLLKDGRLLVAGGNKNAPGTGAELYDLARGVSVSLDSGLPEHATATLLFDGRVLMTSDVYAEVFDPKDEKITPVPIAIPPGFYEQVVGPRERQVPVLLPDGRVLFTGGVVSGDAQNHGAPLPVYYNPATNRFTIAGPLLTSRDRHTATLLPDGRVLIAGGGRPAAPTASVELFNKDAIAKRRSGPK